MSLKQLIQRAKQEKLQSPENSKNQHKNSHQSKTQHRNTGEHTADPLIHSDPLVHADPDLSLCVSSPLLPPPPCSSLHYYSEFLRQEQYQQLQQFFLNSSSAVTQDASASTATASSSSLPSFPPFVCLSGRRCCPLPFSSSSSLPSVLQSMINKIQLLLQTQFPAQLSEKPLNHLLINAYTSSQGILPHTDGPGYSSVAFIYSLGTPVQMHFYQTLAQQYTHRDTTAPGSTSSSPLSSASSDALFFSDVYGVDYQSVGSPVYSLYLEPNSLVVFSEEMYSKHLHYIAACTQDTLTPERTGNYQQIKENLLKEQVAASNAEKEETFLCSNRTGPRISFTIRHKYNEEENETKQQK